MRQINSKKVKHWNIDYLFSVAWKNIFHKEFYEEREAERVIFRINSIFLELHINNEYLKTLSAEQIVKFRTIISMITNDSINFISSVETKKYKSYYFSCAYEVESK